MKKLSIFLSTLFIGGVLVFVSCNKTGPTGPTGPTGQTGPAGPGLTGSITGNIIMTNQYGVAVTNNYTGGYITLKNSTTGATVDSIVPPNTGQYTISNIPTGTYNMYAVYAGYGISETLGLVITGGTRPADIKLAKIPDFNPTSASDSIWSGKIRKDSGIVYLYGSIAPNDTGGRILLVFVGNTTSTSSTPGTYNYVTTITVPPGAKTYALSIGLNTFFANGFTNGNAVYFAVYGAAVNYTYGDYTNYIYGQTVYTPINSTAVSAPVLILPL